MFLGEEVESETSLGEKDARSGSCEEKPHAAASAAGSVVPCATWSQWTCQLLPEDAGGAAGSGPRMTVSRTFSALPTADLRSF